MIERSTLNCVVGFTSANVDTTPSNELPMIVPIGRSIRNLGYAVNGFEKRLSVETRFFYTISLDTLEKKRNEFDEKMATKRVFDRHCYLGWVICVWDFSDDPSLRGSELR